MQKIQSNPELVRTIYKNMAELHQEEVYKEPYTTDFMIEIFGYEDHHIYAPDSWFEDFSYIAIWVLPLLFF